MSGREKRPEQLLPEQGTADGHRDKGWQPSNDRNDELEFALPPPATVSRRSGLLFVVVALLVVAVLFVLGFVPRWRQSRRIREQSAETARAAPRVELVFPKELTQDRPLQLPGITEALEDTVVYPRVSGYVRRWLVDIGDLVKEGQLLAEIDTPELDAQIEQARADLVQAQAGQLRAVTSSMLSVTEQQRYEMLTPAGVTSGQELEQRRTQARVDEASVKVAKATVASMQANLNRLTRTKVFAHPVAPFSGTVTVRSIERGALVSADSKTPMFRVAALDPIRIFVQVPQDLAPSIRVGSRADVKVREFPTRTFDGTVTRSAGALDDSTRTMTTELRVPNSQHVLMPGMYVNAMLALAVPHRVFEIPSTTLYVDGDGVRVAVVNAENKVELRRITIERDTGNSIEVSTGLASSDRIVKISNAALVDGTVVEVMQSQEGDNDPGGQDRR